MLDLCVDGELACGCQSREMLPKWYAACTTAGDKSSVHSPRIRHASNCGVEAGVDCS